MATHGFGHVARTSEQQVVVFLAARATYLDKWCVLLAIITTHGQVGTQPLAYLYVYTCTVVPAVVVQSAEVSILIEVATACKVVHVVGSTAHVHTVLVGKSCFPIVVKQVIVQSLHGFQFVSLEDTCGQVGRGIGGVCHLHCVVQASIIVGAQHLGACHLIGKSKGAVVRDAGRTFLSFLGGHQDDTVGSAGSINGSRCVFEHGDALHLRGIQVVECLSTQVLVGITHLHIVGVDVVVDNEKGLLGSRTNITHGVHIANA